MRDPNKIKVVDESEALVVVTYALTKGFPRDERFGLVSQMRRSAISVGSNIVEGCHRHGNKAFLAFLHQAVGSAAELEFQIRIARRLGFGDADRLEKAHLQTVHVKAMLINLIVALRRRGP